MNEGDKYSINRRLDEELTKLFFKYTTYSNSYQITVGLIVYYVLKEYITDIFLLVWISVLILIGISRILVVKLFWKYQVDKKDTAFIKHTYLLLVYITAMVWGTLIFIQPDIYLSWHLLFILIVILSVSVSVSIALSYLLAASIPFVLLMIVPLICFIFQHGGPPNITMSLILIFYLILLIRNSISFNRLVVDGYKTTLETYDVFKFLKLVKQKTEEKLKNYQLAQSRLDKQSGFRYRCFENIKSPVCILDENFLLIDGNAEFYRFTGLDKKLEGAFNFMSLLEDNKITGFKELFDHNLKPVSCPEYSVNLKNQNGNFIHCKIKITHDNGFFYLIIDPPEGI